MRWCPNSSCSFARKFNRPAEYTDAALSCSDCGATLTEVPPAVAPSVASPVVHAQGNDAVERLLVTLACGAGLLALLFLPAFGLPHSILGGDDVAVPLLPFGVTPFMTAFILVEVGALLAPGLRATRVGGAERRRGLDRTAWVVGGALLVGQLLGLQRTTETMLPLRAPWVLWVQWLAAEGAMLWLAVTVSRRGLGSGWSLVLGANTAVELARQVGTVYKALVGDIVPVGAVLLPAALVIGATVWAVRLSRASRAWGPGKPSTTPFPVSGTGTWALGGAIISLAATAKNGLGLNAVDDALMRSPVLYAAVEAFIAFDFTVVLGVLFFRPAAVAGLWARWGTGVDEAAVTAGARALLPRALLLSMAVLIGAPLVLTVLGGSFPSASLFLMGAVVVGLVLVDLVDEFQAVRRLGPLVSVWEVQRTAEVEPIVRALGERGIEAYPRAFGARTTQQFFAPWMPVCVLVPKAQEAAARAFIASRVDG